MVNHPNRPPLFVRSKSQPSRVVTVAPGDYFQNAAAAPPPPRSNKAEKNPSVPVANLAYLAKLEMVQDAISEEIGNVRGQIDGAVTEFQISEGCRLMARPGNFRGTDGEVFASCEIRKRGSNVELKPEEVAFLQRHHISIEEKVQAEERYFFNDSHLKDPAMRARITEALRAARLPLDIIQKQEKRSINVVAESAVHEIFRKPLAVARHLFPIIFNVSVGKFVMPGLDDPKKFRGIVGEVANLLTAKKR